MPPNISYYRSKPSTARDEDLGLWFVIKSQSQPFSTRLKIQDNQQKHYSNYSIPKDKMLKLIVQLNISGVFSNNPGPTHSYQKEKHLSRQSQLPGYKCLPVNP